MNADMRFDGRLRGIPVDSKPLSEDDISASGWRPQAGETALPVLTLDRPAFAGNLRAMFAYAKAVGADLAPHAKTPMSPHLCADLIEAGAFGLTVADARQARVLLEAGFTRIILANQIGGLRSGERLGRMLKNYPQAAFFAFADSIEAAAAIEAAADAAGRTLGVLVEVGGARAGIRTFDEARSVVARVAGAPSLDLAGVAAYEGASATSDPAETRAAIARLHDLAKQTFALIRATRPDGELIITAGGSSFFDLVVQDFDEIVRSDGRTRLVLRSGAIFFHDHGVYERGLAAMDARGGFAPAGIGPAVQAFTPALRLWAEILSRPEPELAICGMGMRDVSFDQGFARPLAVWREGKPVGETSGASIVKLNDQHAFLRISKDADWRVGDIVEFGISHPCTCLDRWRCIFERDETGAVRRILPTFFG